MLSAQSLPLMSYLFRLGRVPGTREHVVHPNYIVVYQVGDDVIDILRVLHSRQQYPWRGDLARASSRKNFGSPALFASITAKFSLAGFAYKP